ncbi:MAG: DNA cytosine methyltransferase [Candidatus Fonsibacter sp.]
MATHRDTCAVYSKSLRAGLDNKNIVFWRVLNTADFGLPQNRPRLYIIGMQWVVVQAVSFRRSGGRASWVACHWPLTLRVARYASSPGLTRRPRITSTCCNCD